MTGFQQTTDRILVGVLSRYISYFFILIQKVWFGRIQKIRVSIRKTFAQFLRNEKQKFSFFAHQFCAKKNNNLRNHSQKSFRAKLPCSAFAKLKFCAIPQFRKNQTVGDSVRVSQNSILEKSCFGMSSYWSLLHIIDQ